MKSFIESQIRRESEHKRISNSAIFLSKIFSTLFPTSLDTKREIIRLKVFSKIISSGIIDLGDRELLSNLDEFKLITYRSSRKKILDSLVNAGLVKKEGENIYLRTDIGEAAWNSIINFLDNYKPVEEEVIEDGGKVYEYVYREITVDERGNCWTTTNLGLRNLGKDSITFLEPSATSIKSKLGIFKIKHSDNIKDYELIIDEDLLKKFRINFAQPLKIGEYIDLWYEYNWPNKYNKNDEGWQYNYDTKKSLVKELMLKFNFPKNYEININTIKKNADGESLPKDCTVFDPIIINNNKEQQMIWRIKNAYPKRRYTISWKEKQ